MRKLLFLIGNILLEIVSLFQKNERLWIIKPYYRSASAIKLCENIDKEVLLN